MADNPNVPARPVLSGEADRNVSLREFEQRLFTLQQQISDRIRAERELVETRANALDKALALASAETERRLAELNHAHKNAVDNWRQSLPREVFDGTVVEWTKWRETVNASMTICTQNSTGVSTLDSRVKTIETMANKITGAMILLGVMGLAGVMALVIALLRLAGFISK